MSATPNDPPIFHITHVDNLASIVREGRLWSDSQRLAKGLPSINIGLQHIKARRRARVVETRANGHLGDYVPFNFCPRSVMLHRISVGHRDFAGDHRDVVHLVSRVSTAIRLGRPWAFTDRHAEIQQALYFDDLDALHEVPWGVMKKVDWRGFKEERQAEFLVHDSFDWAAVEKVVVHSEAVAIRARAAIASAEHQPPVTAQPKWYYT